VLNDWIFGMDPDFLLLLFLPALIYESAASVDYHTFKRQSGKIILMAFPMLLAASYLTALVMFYVLNYGAITTDPSRLIPPELTVEVPVENGAHRLLEGVEGEVVPEAWSPPSVMPWSACVLFGAVISATDPVAVVSLLKQLGAPKSIGTLIEGESLLNDGTAVVIFYVAIEFVMGKPLTIG
jgi:NhaP-type Na+/H+ or K+/H+ antiporter